MKKTARSLLLAFVASALLLPVAASQYELIGARKDIQIRALPVPVLDSSAASSADSTTAAAPTTTTQPQTTTPQTTQTTTPNSPTTTSPTAGSSSAAATSAAATTHQNSPSSASSEQPSPIVTSVPTVATNSEGQVVTSYVYTTAASSASPSQTSSTSNDPGNGGLSTGSIVGLSVAGGIAAIGIISFFVWKFTRKRFSDFDDNEAIKWPELNAHDNDVHALPTNATGRTGFGPENDSDINLTRPPSPGGTYANSIAASSVPEMYGAGDPYAVPPLPHLNPNQPYRDEPGAYGQSGSFYDPYRGPVPNTFADDAHGTEAIPMTQMARMRSPAPQATAYDMQGRASPAPQAALGYPGERSGTPTGGRGSPTSYGYGPR